MTKIASITLSICFILFFSTVGVSANGYTSQLYPHWTFPVYHPTQTDPLYEPWRWRIFSDLDEQGLRCMTVDQNGKIWFGTQKGVQSYDGLTWQSFASPQDDIYGNTITALCAAPNGHVYAGTEWGLSQYDGQQWQRLFPLTNDTSWPIEKIISKKDGSLWAATAWGVLHKNNMQPWELFTSADIKLALTKIYPKLIIKVVPNHLISPTTTDTLPAKQSGVGIQIIEGSYIGAHRGTVPKTIWRITPHSPAENAGLTTGMRILADDATLNTRLNSGMPNTSLYFKKSPTHPNLLTTTSDSTNYDYRLTRSRIKDTFRTFYAYDIYEDQEGKIWVGLTNGQVYTYSPQEQTWANLQKPYDFFGDHPRILKATNHDLWIVSNRSKSGVYHRHNNQWTYTLLKDLGGRNINNALIEARDGSIWIAGFQSLHKFQNGQWHIYKTPLPLPGSRIVDLIEHPQGSIWIAGQNQFVAHLDYDDTHWETIHNHHFQCQDKNGINWFLSEDKQVWAKKDQDWVTFGTKDGLMDSTSNIFLSKNGTVWAIGKHQNIAATSYYHQNHWVTTQHAKFSNSFHDSAIDEYPQGTFYFGARGNSVNQKTQTGGLLSFDNQMWSSQTIDGENSAYGVGHTSDGTIWAGGYYGLRQWNGEKWAKSDHPILSTNVCEFLFNDSKDNLWVGTRHYGIFKYDGNRWQQFNNQNGLPSNRVTYITQTDSNRLWINTDGGICVYNFEVETWISNIFPFKNDQITLKASQDGSLWINLNDNINKFRTLKYIPNNQAPETQMLFSINQIPQSGTVTLEWTGIDKWQETHPNALKYAWRMNNAPWSPFTSATNQIFPQLPHGNYTFEVKAIDHDVNVDATPAKVAFTILPPVWQQSWFLSLMAILLSAIGYLSIRVIKRDRDLSVSNKALSEANKQLFDVNQNLTHEMSERERLDTQIQNLQFLYTLRTKLTESQTTDQAIQIVGITLTEVLPPQSYVAIYIDETQHTFGNHQVSASHTYQRTLRWGERARGELTLNTSISLSESQERTLLDETAGQLTRSLESRELQMQLLQSARLVSLGQMAAGVAHELNQPLGGISATAEDYYLRLQDNMPISNDQLSETFKRILGMVDRMSNTVEHLRVFSRDTSQEPGKPLQINDIIHSSLDIIGTQLKNHGIEVQLELTNAMPQALGHPYQLEQIFLNLLGNARDALDAKASNGAFKTITISTYQSANSIFVKVQDNGIGISSEHLNHIFEPFYTTKPADKGTGLGLSITYAIVKNHGGNITCSSTKNQGTTFEVSFPMIAS